MEEGRRGSGRWEDGRRGGGRWEESGERRRDDTLTEKDKVKEMEAIKVSVSVVCVWGSISVVLCTCRSICVWGYLCGSHPCVCGLYPITSKHHPLLVEIIIY